MVHTQTVCPPPYLALSTNHPPLPPPLRRQSAVLEVQGLVNSPTSVTEESCCPLSDNFGESRVGQANSGPAHALGLHSLCVPPAQLAQLVGALCQPSSLPFNLFAAVHLHLRSLTGPAWLLFPIRRPGQLRGAVQVGAQPAVPPHVPALTTRFAAQPPPALSRLPACRQPQLCSIFTTAHDLVCTLNRLPAALCM